jgi:hypothetical protein
MIKVIATFLLIFQFNFSLNKPPIKYNRHGDLIASGSERTWIDWFRKTQKETELVDDQTEKSISNNKLLFILVGLVFSGIAYRSLIIKRKK